MPAATLAQERSINARGGADKIMKDAVELLLVAAGGRDASPNTK